MKSSVEVDLGTGRMRSEVENTLPNPEVKEQRKSRDRGRDTRQTEDMRKGHKPMEQVTLHTETSDGCVVTDALGAKGQEETKQKDNMEVNQTETPELAQNKMADKESTTRAANENKGEDEKMEHDRKGVPEPSSTAQVSEPEALETRQVRVQAQMEPREQTLGGRQEGARGEDDIYQTDAMQHSTQEDGT